MNFLYTVDEYSDEPIMLIDKHIGIDENGIPGIIGNQFQQELLQLDSGKYGEKKRIKVWINSEGGSVKDGYDIYNAILKSSVKVDTYCTGMAASTAGWIFQAGRNRVMADYSFLMMHNPYTASGESDTDAIKIFKNSISTMIANRSGKTCDEVQKLMDKETWMTASECFSAGFCDSIELSNEHNKRRMAAAATVKDRLIIANKIIHNKIEKPNMSTGHMPEVTNALKLNPEASQEAIAQEIKNIVNRATKAEMKKKELEDQLNELNLQIAKEKEAKDKLKNDMEAENKAIREAKNEEIEGLKADMKNKLAEFELLKKEKADNEAKNHLAKCTEMVNNFAKQGRIKNDTEVINKWINKAVSDYEGVETLIKDLPLNKTAVVLNHETKNEVNIPASHRAEAIMLEISARNAKK